MKALVYLGPVTKTPEERPKPEITAPTDAIVKIIKTTIWGTDLHILKGDVPSSTASTKPAASLSPAPNPTKARQIYSLPTDRAIGIICDQRIVLEGRYPHRHFPQQLRRMRFKDPQSGKTFGVPHQSDNAARRDHLSALQKSLAVRAIF